MKTTLKFFQVAMILAFASIKGSVFATTHTVSNNPANPAQFSVIQEAINAAVDGDTIYVSGSDIQYGNVLVNRRLVIIGAGYIQNGNNTRTTVTQLDFASTTDNGGGSGSVVKGLRIVGNVDGDPDQVISNVLIERNLIEQVVIDFGMNDNWTFRNNIVFQTNSQDWSIGTSSNLIFANNILQGAIGGGTFRSVFTASSSTLSLINNVFFDYVFIVSNCLFANNVFVDHAFNSSTGSSTSVTYNNNLFFSGNSDPIGTSNTFTNNIFDAAGFTNETNNFYNFLTDDLSLSAASPGADAGTDGTDLGIFGGNFPMVFEPGTPEITSFIINTISVPTTSGQLEFTISAEGRN